MLDRPANHGCQPKRLRFSFTQRAHRTQRKRLRAFEWKPGFKLITKALSPSSKRTQFPAKRNAHTSTISLSHVNKTSRQIALCDRRRAESVAFKKARNPALKIYHHFSFYLPYKLLISFTEQWRRRHWSFINHHLQAAISLTEPSVLAIYRPIRDNTYEASSAGLRLAEGLMSCALYSHCCLQANCFTQSMSIVYSLPWNKTLERPPRLFKYSSN